MASNKKQSQRKFSLNALSFFSGALGMDLGLEAAGVHICCASEIDSSTRETIKANKPDLPLLGDILSYSASDVLELSGLQRGEVDLVVGGPPCQAFSSAGKRQGFEDARGNVFLAYLDLAFALNPRYVVVENVRGLLSAALRHRPHQLRGSGYPELTPEERPGGALHHILERFERAGYGVSFNLYNSANFGVPQIRERVILIACKNGERLPYLTPTHSEDRKEGLRPWTTFKQATEDLPPEPCDHVEFPEKRLKYYRLLREGQYWKDLPPKLQKEALGKSYLAGGGKTGFFRRLAWDKPSPTL
jgi:DNA (cytosine-5)-methyltransferase 1